MKMEYIFRNWYVPKGFRYYYCGPCMYTGIFLHICSLTSSKLVRWTRCSCCMTEASCCRHSPNFIFVQDSSSTVTGPRPMTYSLSCTDPIALPCQIILPRFPRTGNLWIDLLLLPSSFRVSQRNWRFRWLTQHRGRIEKQKLWTHWAES